LWSGCSLDPSLGLLFFDRFEDHLIAASEEPHPRPASADWLEHMQAFYGRLPAGML
jgi:hypothetical protein